MIGVPPEVYELVHLDVDMAKDSGIFVVRKQIISVFSLLYGETKRRAHDHDHPRYLPQLLGEMRDDSGVISVKDAPKRPRQGWLSGGCFPLPPPAPLFLLRCTKASVISVSFLKCV